MYFIIYVIKIKLRNLLIRLKERIYNISIICTHVTTEVSDDVKDQLQKTRDNQHYPCLRREIGICRF